MVEVSHQLNELFNHKCAYCESPAKGRPLVDRFRPMFGARGQKKEFAEEHYWWLSYEWNNLYSICEECSKYKANWFPVDGERCALESPYEQVIEMEHPLLIDPCNDYPEEHLEFLESGEVVAKSERGSATIEILRLNRKSLISARRKSGKQFLDQWSEFSINLENPERNWDNIINIANKLHVKYRNISQEPHLQTGMNLFNNKLEEHPTIKAFFGDKLYAQNASPISKDDLIKIFGRAYGSSQSKKSSGLGKHVVDQIVSKYSFDLGSRKQLFLEKLELENFKCFEHLSIDLSKKSNAEYEEGSQPWHLLLGENGVGKSTILKAISIALMAPRYREKMHEHLEPKKLLKYGKRKGFIKLTYNNGEVTTVDFTNARLTSNVSETLANVIGYGSVRLLPKRTLEPEAGEFEGVKVENLFDYTVALADADDWLMEQTTEHFDRAAIVLKDIMLLDDEAKLVRDKKNKAIYVESPLGDRTFMDDLSDGYKMVYAMAVDIMATLSSENVRYDVAEGIVLIDEIGNHLHPRWKMKVVERMRAAFPRLQFLVTSHEPLCLRGLKAGETIVLRRNEHKQVVVITDLPDPSELRIDQILTSEFFGLNSTIDEKTEKLYEEYYAILAKDEDERNEDEKSRLLELSALMPRMRLLGDNVREELVYYVIDELLAKKVKQDGGFKLEELKPQAIDRVKNLWDSLNIQDL